MKPEPTIRMWLTEPLSPVVKKAIERLKRLDDVRRIAIMPDVHLAQRICIGCVIATRDLIYPAAVGNDIGCGIATVALDGSADLLRDAELARAWVASMRAAIPVMRHRSLAAALPWPTALTPDDLSRSELITLARREGRIELGTLGRGNHFLELQADPDDRLWLMVHSGSRAMGQAITHLHTARAHPARSGLECLSMSDDAGRAYLHDVDWAVRYAATSRRAMLEAATRETQRILGTSAAWETSIDCNHNHVRIEAHGSDSLLVHRKGASPASLDEPGLIPGCMGGESFHTLGRGQPDSLRSSSHGAGRAMSRTEARRRISPRQMLRQLEGIAFDDQSAAALREEAPAAYKDVHAVMRAQRDLVRIVRSVRALACYKGV